MLQIIKNLHKIFNFISLENIAKPWPRYGARSRLGRKRGSNTRLEERLYEMKTL